MTGSVAEVSRDHASVESLRAKYAEERNRRLDPRKNEQFIEVTGEYRHFVDDPWIEAPITRGSIEEVVEALVIGGGFGGLLASAGLKKIGIDDIRIVEKAGDFGGTWYWNRYPGAQCDIESYIYLPLLEETAYIPTEKYAHAPEIFEHAQRIGRHFGLYDKALFQTEITSMDWDEAALRWTVRTDRGDLIQARYVLTASGPLNRPKLPGISGISRFKGHMFHTSRWDYGYTGGDANGGMTRLADKKVAVLGTGATAVQCVPYLARDAQHVYVVQRTPSNVGARGNRPTDPDWVKSLAPGWQRERMENFNAIVSGARCETDFVADGWTELFSDMLTNWRPEDGRELALPEAMALMERADFQKGEEMRAWIAAHVERPEVAEALKPWYGVLCKRPAFNDDYLPSFNRDNVTLIDTHGAGVDEITGSAIVCNGVSYPVDCIIFATGFEVGTTTNRTAGAAIRGVGGELLAGHFADGPRTLHGFYVHGFPNLFLLGSGNNAVKPNITDMLAEQVDHLVDLIAKTRAVGAKRIEATAGGEAEWRQIIVAKSQGIRAMHAQCTPGYFNAEGDIEKSWSANTYGGGALEFSALLNEWRERGDNAGLKIS
ncbi:monooxygenase (plasmid) [Sphingomonas panacis]|uniref:Monooxygenase n=1 Tax=Sphingomonas panacis TaxID=1560345 RepID=A0A1B3ZIH7_9SPHN|nr:NAD(P)/FAD-dependent oxidoreductase [Sphingomonas panacis]AOH87225.1 monooxygenase [Sphingomonas panacis]